MSGEKSVDFTW